MSNKGIWKKNECLKTLQTTKMKDFYEMQQLMSFWINMRIFYGKLCYSHNRTFSLENVENFIKGTGHNWRFKSQFPHSSCTTLATHQKRPLICLHIFYTETYKIRRTNCLFNILFEACYLLKFYSLEYCSLDWILKR